MEKRIDRNVAVLYDYVPNSHKVLALSEAYNFTSNGLSADTDEAGRFCFALNEKDKESLWFYIGATELRKIQKIFKKIIDDETFEEKTNRVVIGELSEMKMRCQKAGLPESCIELIEKNIANKKALFEKGKRRYRNKYACSNKKNPLNSEECLVVGMEIVIDNDNPKHPIKITLCHYWGKRENKKTVCNETISRNSINVTFEEIDTLFDKAMNFANAMPALALQEYYYNRSRNLYAPS